MSNVPPPGLGNQSGARTTARVLAVVLLLGGLFLLVRGIRAFLASADSVAVDGGFSDILMIAAGGFMVVFGLAAANVGWLGAGARYAAGETMPVVKDSAAYLTDGRGIAGVGQSAAPAAEPAAELVAGPFCRACGTRNDESAAFCVQCGQSLS